MASTIGRRQNVREIFATKEPVKLQVVSPQQDDVLMYDPLITAFRNTQALAVVNSQLLCISEANLFFSSQF